jgi:hypothetical protein
LAEPKASHEKTLEMRVAELEDKLAKLHVTEDEMRAYEKVSSLMASQGAAGETGAAALSPQICTISRSRLVCIHRGPIARQIVRFCYECNCGPCIQGGADFTGGGGFGGFGT